MRFFFSILLLLSFLTANSQILNVESLRQVTDTSGFSGSASLDFSLKRDVKSYLGFINNNHVQYQMRRHLVLIKTDIQFQRVAGDKFQNSGIGHLRYNYRLFPRMTWELFGQAQYNKVAKINFRGLVGTGARFKLTDESEKFKFYLGSLVMYEYEELDESSPNIQRTMRNSSYFSASVYPTEDITIISTTYYQPKLSHLSDYHVSSQSSLLIKLFENFAFKTTYTFVYESKTAENVPNSQYNLTTGIAYSFE